MHAVKFGCLICAGMLLAGCATDPSKSGIFYSSRDFDHRIETRKFEGVKSSAYFRIYA